jgi:hypothetical protein
MPSCPFVHRVHQSKGEKVPKSGGFKNEGIPEKERLILRLGVGYSRPFT